MIKAGDNLSGTQIYNMPNLPTSSGGKPSILKYTGSNNLEWSSSAHRKRRV